MKRWHLILIAFVLVPVGIWMYLARPIYLAEVQCPHPLGGKIRIAEFPSSGLVGFLLRDNPRYRFEYVYPDRYIWASATFVGESYRANTGKIVWENNSRAICYLDDIPIFVLNGRIFEDTKSD